MFYSQALMKVHLCKTGSKNKKNIFDIWLLISWLWRDTHTPLEGVRSCSSFPLFGYALKPTSCLNRLPWTLVTPKAPNFGDYNFSQLLKETKKKWNRDSSEGFLYAYSKIRHEIRRKKGDCVLCKYVWRKMHWACNFLDKNVVAHSSNHVWDAIWLASN